MVLPVWAKKVCVDIKTARSWVLRGQSWSVGDTLAEEHADDRQGDRGVVVFQRQVEGVEECRGNLNRSDPSV